MIAMSQFVWAGSEAPVDPLCRPSCPRVLVVFLLFVQCALSSPPPRGNAANQVLVHKSPLSLPIDALTAATVDAFCAEFSKMLTESPNESRSFSWEFWIGLDNHERRGQPRLSVSAMAGNVTVQVGTIHPKDALKQKRIAALVRRSVAISRDPYLRAFVTGEWPFDAGPIFGQSKQWLFNRGKTQMGGQS